jgi:hypothetical protein
VCGYRQPFGGGRCPVAAVGVACRGRLARRQRERPQALEFVLAGEPSMDRGGVDRHCVTGPHGRRRHHCRCHCRCHCHCHGRRIGRRRRGERRRRRRRPGQRRFGEFAETGDGGGVVADRLGASHETIDRVEARPLVDAGRPRLDGHPQEPGGIAVGVRPCVVIGRGDEGCPGAFEVVCGDQVARDRLRRCALRGEAVGDQEMPRATARPWDIAVDRLLGQRVAEPSAAALTDRDETGVVQLVGPMVAGQAGHRVGVEFVAQHGRDVKSRPGRDRDRGQPQQDRVAYGVGDSDVRRGGEGDPIAVAHQTVGRLQGREQFFDEERHAFRTCRDRCHERIGRRRADEIRDQLA